MEKRVTLTGTYSHRESRHVSSNWAQICADHEEEFPEIRACHPGTFNVVLANSYRPPDDDALRQKARARGLSVRRYVDGNHVSPTAKVVEINGKPVDAWIYRGGHGGRPVVELLSRLALADYLRLSDGSSVSLIIVEHPESQEGMPGMPPTSPGRSV